LQIAAFSFTARSRPVDRIGSGPMHLRMPSIDKGVQSFIWAIVFFLYIFFGMKAIGIDGATSLIVGLVAGFLIFLFVRTRGDMRD
jgi:purine-cytosine permease-like protein